MSGDTIYKTALVEVLDGLRQPQKSISPKFFYDACGSALFAQITRLDEYYPTRTEMGIMRAKAAEIAAAVGPGAAIVEFGAGNLEKIRLLLEFLDRPRAYVPIDISAEHMTAAAAVLAADFPGLAVVPVTGDYTEPVILPRHPALEGARRVGFFPGSTIGNFPPHAAGAFLRNVGAILDGGPLLLGVDMVKDVQVLHDAYNDAAGVTAAFNLNILAHLNRLIGADFEPARFRHKAFFNSAESRVEMHLAAAAAHSVRMGGEQIAFAAGETIHTENSYKYTPASVAELASAAGWQVEQTWYDARLWFGLYLLRNV